MAIIFALPVAVSLAVRAVVVGALGYYAKTRLDAAEQRGESRGKAKAKADYELRLRHYKERLAARVADDERFYRDIETVALVGYACAQASNSGLTNDLRDLIHEFVVGAASQRLPQRSRERLDAASHEPLAVEQAYAHALSSAPDVLDLCDEIVALLLDDPAMPPDPSARQFEITWHRLRASAGKPDDDAGSPSETGGPQ